ncbi:MAG: NAD(P)/FAD-dependent oxidoreductase [Thermotaleaceae bacterium]
MNDPKFATLQKVRNGKKTFGITPRIPGGFISPEQLIKIGEIAKKYKGTLKITSGQRVAILGLQPEDVPLVWKELDMEPAVLSPYSVKNVEMCPASFCKRAKQNSLRLGMKLEKALYGTPTPNRTKVGVAGCRNACTSVYSKDIGIIADVDGYMVTVGGSAGFHQRLSEIVTVGLREEDAFLVVRIILDYYNTHGSMGEKMGAFIDRIGFTHFQKEVMKILNNEKNKS